ncbi:hypothetical protein [Paenibacillus pabuli]|nr:hypothetical protein [Paenibacillus pabuli]
MMGGFCSTNWWRNNYLIFEEIEEVAWMEPQRAEEYIHVPSELKELIIGKSLAPYVLRGTIDHNS